MTATPAPAPSRQLAAWLALSLAAWWGFFRLADWMLSGAADPWNIAAMQLVPTWHAGWLNPLVVGLTQCGSEVGLTVIGLLSVIYLLRRGQRQEAMVVALLLIGTAFWTFGIKAVYVHPRPQVFPPLVAETGYSFPSGHALAGWGFFGYVTLWARRHGERLIGLVAALLALTIPLSRIYLGVHWPTDVLAGLCLGTFWLGLCQAIRLSRGAD
jgi:undecaprenyl-diphosphatase